MGDTSRSTFRTHLEHSPTVDPFKGALFKLMGKVEPHRRNLPYVTGTTEDWLWFQLAMVCYANTDILLTRFQRKPPTSA